MAFLHRVLLTWFLGLVFLILLAMRLDQRTNWNWFIVFIPLWLFDLVVITYCLFYIISRLRTSPRQICTTHVRRKLYVLGAVLLKMSTQILLCLKLSSWNLPLYCIFTPVWCLLSIGLIRIIIILGGEGPADAVASSLEQVRSTCRQMQRAICVTNLRNTFQNQS